MSARRGYAVTVRTADNGTETMHVAATDHLAAVSYVRGYMAGHGLGPESVLTWQHMEDDTIKTTNGAKQ